VTDRLPSYRKNDPKGWRGDITRGAALGRKDLPGPTDFRGELFLKQVEMDPVDIAYDILGTYWGTGAPIWWLADLDCEIEHTFRADTYEAARAWAKANYPEATIT
jgi:hypothetical protein